MSTHMLRTAFPLDFIASLPKIEDLVRHIHPNEIASDQTAVLPMDEEDNFELIKDDRSRTSSPVPDVSSLSIDSPQPIPSTVPKSAFVDMLVRESQEQAVLSLTDNGALTYSTSLNPILDLFYAVKEKSAASQIRQHLKAAWQVDPLQALKLLFFLRDVRDGKGCHEEFYVAAEWLLRNHPETFRYNVIRFCPRFGCWKDLLQLLARECPGQGALDAERESSLEKRRIYDPEQRALRQKVAKAKHAHRVDDISIYKERRWYNRIPALQHNKKTPSALKEKKLRNKARRAEYATMTPEDAAKARAEFAMAVEQREESIREAVKHQRLENRNNAIAKCRARWSQARYRTLHVEIAKQFAFQLYLDKRRLDSGKQVSSLCAKWAPSPHHYYDKHTCIATTIALILFPPSKSNTSESEAEYISRALRLYQSKYLAPLRQAAQITETLMSSGQWDRINYAHVPSICLKRNQKVLVSHGPNEGFVHHVHDVAARKGRKRVRSSILKPHEIVAEVMTRSGYPRYDGDTEKARLDSQVNEAQWLNYVENIKEAGSLDNCIAVADVSGSMERLPLQCCIALSLLVCTVSKPPFNRTFITFSERPQIVVLPKNLSLERQVNFVRRLPWGMNTNLQGVFDLILNRAKRNNLAKEDMIKTIFVFSDMQFDEACGNSPRALETDYEQIKRKFNESGYDVPQIIFWNLSESERNETPVLFDTIGTAMVSGWSGQLLKMFMEGGSEMISHPEFRPEFVVKKAVSKPNYDVLKVLD